MAKRAKKKIEVRARQAKLSTIEDHQAHMQASDAWFSAPEAARKNLALEFQKALQPYLPGLADANAAAELEAVFHHPRMRTVRRGAAKAEVTKIRRLLERVAAHGATASAWSALFARRREEEHLEPIIAAVYMLQVWRNAGALATVLDMLENEAAAIIDSTPETGAVNWAGVWAIDALVSLWVRQSGKPWTSATVKWEGQRSRGAYLRAGFTFLNRFTELSGTVEAAFNRWVEIERAPKVV